MQKKDRIYLRSQNTFKNKNLKNSFKKKKTNLKCFFNLSTILSTMRWKALDFLGKLDNQVKNTYGFKSSKCPPSVEELSRFESDLLMMIHNVEFQPVKKTDFYQN